MFQTHQTLPTHVLNLTMVVLLTYQHQEFHLKTCVNLDFSKRMRISALIFSRRKWKLFKWKLWKENPDLTIWSWKWGTANHPKKLFLKIGRASCREREKIEDNTRE